MKNEKLDLVDRQKKLTQESSLIQKKVNLVIENFKKVLYEDDDTFMKIMATNNLGGDDLAKYRHWEWPQGVGLFGFWKMFEQTNEKKYLDLIIRFYEEQIKIGFPTKNVNTCAPLLTLAYLYEYTKEEKYKKVCMEWAEWLMYELPKTKEGGFQHLTSDSLNENELWVDTLFMTALFLSKIGCVLEKKDWVEEAKYQFLLHTKYLSDRESGLWFHGWSFKDCNHFAGALWGRGNCWVTVAIPEFLGMVDCEPSIKRYLTQTLNRQIDALEKYQDESGMWHTLIDDPTSYVEASATCGFAYGILKAAHMGIIEERLTTCARKAIKPILACIDEEGNVGQVSYGTYMGRVTKEYYKGVEIRPMPYGQAMAILFLMEALRQN